MNKCLYILLTCLCLALPREVSASNSSMPTDPVSLEAMIYNHKTIKAVLELRVLAEEGVRAYHKKSMKTMEDHEAVAKRLDKYRKCFEKIDLILNATATGFHTYNSFKHVREISPPTINSLTPIQKRSYFMEPYGRVTPPFSIPVNEL